MSTRSNSKNNRYILELQNLDKSYGDFLAVDDICINISDGEFLTLLGPSGSGKTTTLLMIAGFEYPDKGEVILKGNSITFLPPNKRNIGMVFQNYALFPHLSIFENIAYPLKMRKVAKEDISKKVTDVLNLVQLPEYEDRYPKQLSGGQQQRIALARAVVFNPPVLLMDEPLGALDKKLREHMQLEIKQIQKKLKRTVIYVTHDQEEALIMSDRIAVINHGKVEQIGTPIELYEKPKNRFVASFLGESNFLEGLITAKKDNLITLKLNDDSQHSIRWDGDITAGEKITFCIRPEKLFVAKNEIVQNSCLEGVIIDAVYVGETLRYNILIGKETVVNLREMNANGSRKYNRGDKVKITWGSGSLRKL